MLNAMTALCVGRQHVGAAKGGVLGENEIEKRWRTISCRLAMSAVDRIASCKGDDVQRAEWEGGSGNADCTEEVVHQEVSTPAAISSLTVSMSIFFTAISKVVRAGIERNLNAGKATSDQNRAQPRTEMRNRSICKNVCFE